MPTIAQLIGPVSDATCNQPDLVRDTVEALQLGRHVGKSDSEATAADLTKLLVALMATDLPIHASCAVERFAALPARWLAIEYLPQEWQQIAVEDAPIPAASGSDWHGIIRSFVGGLGYFIDLAMTKGARPDIALTKIRVRRSLGRPAAKLILVLGNGVSVELAYTVDDAVPLFDRADDSAMVVMTEMPAPALWRLAGLLGGWHRTTTQQKTASPRVH